MSRGQPWPHRALATSRDPPASSVPLAAVSQAAQPGRTKSVAIIAA